MKRIILLMLLNVAFGCIAWSQAIEWAKRAGLWAYDYGYGITTDKSGNIYLSGKYEKEANFSGTILPMQGNHDIYLAKYSPAGALLWIRTAGGTNGDYATCIAIDDSYVYIAGEIEGTGKIVFPGSPITLYGKGSNDVFIAKYDHNGNLIWARRAGYIYWDKALGIACDASGNIFICGYYHDKTVFGSVTLMGYGEEDIFIAKYDANGDFKWVRRAGGPGKDEAKEIVIDKSGNAYITGMFKYTADFSGTTVTAKGGTDIFTAKYSTSGSLQWVKVAGSAHNDISWSMTIDDNDKIFIAGDFNASIILDDIKLTTLGHSDVFVARYNTSGTVEWAKRAGGSLFDRARGIGTNGDLIFITGQYGGSATFGNVTHTAADSSDIFFSALNNSGDFLWTTVVGGVPDSVEELGYESGNTITAYNSNVYASGALLNGGTFGSTTLNAYKRTDIFLTKIKHGSGGSGGTTVPSVLIYPNSAWLYHDYGSNLGTAWRNKSYNISGWKIGNAQLGYGEGDEATEVDYGSSSSNKHITTYFRRSFNLPDVSAIEGLELSLLRDDGAVVYINGTEVFRSNMPDGTIDYNTLAKYGVGAAANSYYKKLISPSVLDNGTNVVCVEVHQVKPYSSDLSFNLKLQQVSSSKTNGPLLQNNVELLSFDGQEKANNIHLAWVTGSEVNNDYFIVERSLDGEVFRPVGIVLGAGNTTNQINYSYTDSIVGTRISREGGTLFYRLNATDFDGIASYSPIISVNVAPLSNISISGYEIALDVYPNPVKQSFSLSFSELPASKLTYTIYDITGNIIRESNILNERTVIDVSSFIPGVYMIGIKSDEEIIFTEKIIVQNRDSK